MKFCRLTLIAIIIIIVEQINVSAQNDHLTWTYNLSVYEVNVRQYTPQGTFKAFETHLDRLKDLGAGILWFMPIHPIGVVNRGGSLGSYYSVKDYYGINPEFGTLDDFKALVDSIHDMGMYVMMDWVANHTSRDNSLTVSHPEWYAKDDDGNFISPPGTNWQDVYQLDFSKAELRAYMIEVMKYWITDVGVDGFRCDAVGLMPLDFWSEAIPQLKSVKPDLFMLAEDNNSKYHTAGFDMSYAWNMLGFGNGILIDIAAGTATANIINSYNTQENTNYPGNEYRLYFTSNHDENSWYGTVFELFGNAAEVLSVLTLTFRSMPLIYSGQEAGLNKRLSFFDKDQIFWRSHKFGDMYKKLLHLKRNNKALWNGEAGAGLKRVTTSNNPAIFAFVREKDENKVFAILNLTNKEQAFTLQGELFPGKYYDVMGGDSTEFVVNQEVILPAWGYKIYEAGSGFTSVDDDGATLSEYTLEQNYPNPFNPGTKINFSLHKRGHVVLSVFNLLGEKVATLVNEELNSGNHEVDFNGANLSSGMYIYTLQAENNILTKKMILIK